MTDPTKTIDFIVASGTLAKRAMDELTSKEAAEKAAQTVIPGVIDQLVAAGLSTDATKEAHASLLTDHAKTLEVLGNLATRYKAATAQQKQASTIGEAVPDASIQSNEPSPYVGVPRGSTMSKASADLFAAMGITVGG